MSLHLARSSQWIRGMETNFIPVTGDTANVQFQLNSANWEVDMLIVPTCEPCDTDASDDQEVR